MREIIAAALTSVISELYQTDIPIVLTRPDEELGDYASNVSLQLAGKLHQPPADLSAAISERVAEVLADQVESVSVVHNFINFRLKDHYLIDNLDSAAVYRPISYHDKVTVVEYSDPNPFKVLHVGHLYTSIIGNGIANLLELAGATVHRVNYGGDVGLHVAKTLWAILQYTTEGHPDDLDTAWSVVTGLETKPLGERASWLAERYVAGSQAYEDDAAKKAMISLNQQVYGFHATNDHDSPIARIYWTCRQWSYDYFIEFYQSIAIHPFERFYPESEMVDTGLQTVREQLAKGVYSESDGAVVFHGERYGLHTRVFISAAGLPTYEAKDVGLILRKWNDYHFDRSITITGNEQVEYMKVVLKSIEQFMPNLVQATTHMTHGTVRLQGGVKMSSRKGNILEAAEVLTITSATTAELIGSADPDITVGAIKYAFLKQRIGPDVVYDPVESVTLIGNSGPYLQYAHARARSVLAKLTLSDNAITDLETAERSLARKITEYPEVIDHAVADLMPHHVCNYLYELAQIFNQFYEHNRVIGDPRHAVRAKLMQAYADTLKNGLQLLDIATPNHL